MPYEDTLDDLKDWFSDRKEKYHYSNQFKTLSGIHYIFYSDNYNRNIVSVEIFANKFDGLQSTICILNNGNIHTSDFHCIDISADEGIKQ